MISNTKLDPILPVNVCGYDEEALYSTLLELNKFGFRRFLLRAPENGVRLTGFPDKDVYRRLGEFLLAIQNRVAGQGMQVGWWCAPTLKSGKADYQRIIGIDGSEGPVSSCPLDEDFKKVFAQNISTVVEIAKPFMIQFEDDFELSNHNPVRFGCFCPLHLKRFAQLTGKEYSREDLMSIFSQVNSESIELRKKWAQMGCDTLTELAAYVRSQVDQVSPETRISLCQAGCADFDGDFTESVAAAFAGNTKPIIRVHGTTYSSDNSQNIPHAVFNVLYAKENLPEHFELIHESDTFPHTRFFMSALKLKSLMGAAFSYGMDDSLFYTTHSLDLDDPLEESGYSEMFQFEQKRFETLKTELQDCHAQGCEICSSPWSHCSVAYDADTKARPNDGTSSWVPVLGQLGIPYSVNPGKVKMLSGHYVGILSDDEIKNLLSASVMMDGKAAYLLAQRGFSDLIGAQIVPGREVKFSSERIEEDAGFKGIKGRLMYNLIFTPAGSEGGSFYEISPLPKAKTLTSFCDPNQEPVVPGMISFENSLGGRVVITAFDLFANRSSSVFNYRKKEIVRQMIEWLGQESLPVFVKDLPNVFCIYNQSDSGEKAVVTLINLCSDPAKQVELAISEKWEGGRIENLNSQGLWDEVEDVIETKEVSLPIKLKLMEPVYLKVSKR